MIDKNKVEKPAVKINKILKGNPKAGSKQKVELLGFN